MSVLRDVVLLREGGRCLPSETLRTTAPVRRLLQLNATRQGCNAAQRDAPPLAGLVLPEASWVIPTLDQTRVRAIRAENILIVGIDEFGLGRNRIERHRQASWGRFVLPGSTTTADNGEIEHEAANRPNGYCSFAWADWEAQATETPVRRVSIRHRPKTRADLPCED